MVHELFDEQTNHIHTCSERRKQVKDDNYHFQMKLFSACRSADGALTLTASWEPSVLLVRANHNRAADHMMPTSASKNNDNNTSCVSVYVPPVQRIKH